MNKAQAIEQLQNDADTIRKMGVTELYLFGSTARDEDTAASDLDLFIDYDAESRFSLIDLVGIKQFLEETMRTEVDITTRDSLHPMLKDDIERNAIRIF